MASLEPDAQQSVSIALLTLNPSLDAGHLNAASTKIKLIDQFVGGDPYLDYFRYMITRSKGENEAALGFIRTAALALPDNFKVNNGYLIMLNRTKNFEDMAKQIVHIADNFGKAIPKQTLLGSPRYREFSQSEAGRKLIEKMR